MYFSQAVKQKTMVNLILHTHSVPSPLLLYMIATFVLNKFTRMEASLIHTNFVKCIGKASLSSRRRQQICTVGIESVVAQSQLLLRVCCEKHFQLHKEPKSADIYIPESEMKFQTYSAHVTKLLKSNNRQIVFLKHLVSFIYVDIKKQLLTSYIS